MCKYNESDSSYSIFFPKVDAFIKSIVNNSPVEVSAHDAALALKVALKIEKKISEV